MRTDFTTGALVASLAAGPILVTPIILFGIAGTMTEVVGALAVAPFFLLFGMLFGFVIALIPNFVGAAALAWAGGRHPSFRHPRVWAATGFGMGWLLAAAAAGFDPGIEALVIGADGLVCALICRRFAAWDD